MNKSQLIAIKAAFERAETPTVGREHIDHLSNPAFNLGWELCRKHLEERFNFIITAKHNELKRYNWVKK